MHLQIRIPACQAKPKTEKTAAGAGPAQTGRPEPPFCRHPGRFSPAAYRRRYPPESKHPGQSQIPERQNAPKTGAFPKGSGERGGGGGGGWGVGGVGEGGGGVERRWDGVDAQAGRRGGTRRRRGRGRSTPGGSRTTVTSRSSQAGYATGRGGGEGAGGYAAVPGYLGRAAQMGLYDTQMPPLKAGSYLGPGRKRRGRDRCERIPGVDGDNRGAVEMPQKPGRAG